MIEGHRVVLSVTVPFDFNYAHDFCGYTKNEADVMRIGVLQAPAGQDVDLSSSRGA